MLTTVRYTLTSCNQTTIYWEVFRRNHRVGFITGDGANTPYVAHLYDREKKGKDNNSPGLYSFEHAVFYIWFYATKRATH